MSRPTDDAISSPPFQLQTVVMTDDEQMDALDSLLPEGSDFGAAADRRTKAPLRKPLAPAGEVEPSGGRSTLLGSGLAVPRKRSVVIGLVVAVVLAQAAVIGYVLRRSAAAPPPPGSLVLETNPPGAAVRIDGINRGVTPLTLPLASGEYRTEVSLGSSRREFRVTMTDGLTVSRHVELTPAAAAAPSVAPGALDLRSRPSGAMVTVDGEPRGRTPLVISNLAPGPHEVLLKHSTGQTVSETLTVPAGAPLQFTAAFTDAPAAKWGWLSVKSPLELSILQNGAVIGTTSSARTMLPAGRHSLEFVSERFGYRSTRTIEIGEGKVVSVVPELPQVAINVNALPWAEVWMGERKLGDTPLGSLSLPVGVHQLVFRHPSLGERRENVTVAVGASVRVSVDMRK